MDAETGLYYYGARYYEPEISLFYGVDRFAEKYANRSGYSYAACNPVKYLDLNGDSIIICLKNTDKVLYNDGNVYWANGEKKGQIYDGKYSTRKHSFLQKTVKALNTIGSGEIGEVFIAMLQSVPSYLMIISNSTNNQSGYRIRWDSQGTEGGLDVNGSTTRPAYIGLAHELAHGLEFALDKKNDLTPWFKMDGKTIPEAEKFSTYWENLIRSEHGLPLREFYGYKVNNNTGVKTGMGSLLQSDKKTSLFVPSFNYDNYKKK